MTPADDGFLDVFTVMDQVLPGVALTPSQLAQVRAASTKYHTARFDLRERTLARGDAWAGPTPAERSELRAMIVDDLRSMLTEEQRPAFERLAAGLDATPRDGRGRTA